jgi:nucleoid-associated protein YgaU
MASDEKTGFIIGLLFISVVAWALNGIPRGIETSGSNELTAAMVSRPVGIRPGLQKFFSPKPAQEEPVLETSPPLQDDKDRQYTPPDETYVVQEGDTLWRIAAQQLGEGRRYKEIAELNAGLVKDVNTLAVGTRLTMPPR